MFSGPRFAVPVAASSSRATKLDWKVELGIVIGGRAKYVTVETAPAYVAGYCDKSSLQNGTTYERERRADCVDF